MTSTLKRAKGFFVCNECGVIDHTHSGLYQPGEEIAMCAVCAGHDIPKIAPEKATPELIAAHASLMLPSKGRDAVLEGNLKMFEKDQD